MRNRVVIVAGPSGTGKSRLAERAGLPMLRLDDFYRDGGDPALPRIVDGPNAGLVDWDHPGSWFPEQAVDTLIRLCRDGRAEVPIYQIAQNGRTGSTDLVLPDRPGGLLLAEGIFAQDIVEACHAAGILAGAFCLDRSATMTAGRRFARDMRERRKPPLVLVRRGYQLMQRHRQVVADAVAKGCVPVSMEAAVAAVNALKVADNPTADGAR